MRKLVLFCLLFYKAAAITAQTDAGGFGAYWDTLMGNFYNDPRISTGYLWERALPDSTVYLYTGKPGDSVAAYDQWSNIYQYWLNASNQAENHNLPYDSVWKQLDRYFKRGISAVPVLYVHANRMNDDLFKAGVKLDSVTGKFIADNHIPLFETRKTFISAPFIQVFYEPSVRLYFGEEFYYTNTGTRIQEIRIKLNNEPYIPVALQAVHEFLLPYEGANTLSIECRLSNGELYYTNVILVKRSMLGQGPGNGGQTDNFHIGDLNWNIYARPLRATETGEPCGAFIDYIPGRTKGALNTCINKPIIFVEGIDFGYKDHPTGYYGGKCGSVGLRDLKSGDLYDPYESNIKKSFSAWDAIHLAPKMLDELQKNGYDLYYLDFHNGADYMENNAMLLVELIQQINARKCTNEEIVVIGASMGGQVAKYALSYMEKHHIPHCTRTYLSFDSPHQGANIPLGFQYLLEYYKGKLPGVKDNYNRKLDRAATKQLLIYHCMSGQPAATHSLRHDFAGQLQKLGIYPSYCRNIAAVNGSIASNDQGFLPGTLLLSIDPYFSERKFNFLELKADLFACYAFNKHHELFVLDAQFPFKKHLLKEVPESTRRIDHVPGGLRYDLRDSRAIYIILNVVNYYDASCFIPTTSGLDIRSGDWFYNASSNISRFKPEPGKYPFHTYYGPKDNEEHVKINDGNINWTIEEIEKNRIELPAFLTTIYNYGQYERFLFHAVAIGTNGKLQFNGNYVTGTGKGKYDGIPEPGSTYSAYSTDCSPLVTVAGQFVVGDDNKENNKAAVYFRRGSTIEIKAGGILKICDNSSLVIEEGARIIYHPGARIILEGANALLQIDGVLKLGENAVFAIEKGSAKTTGYIKFRNTKSGGKAGIELAGKNISIRLSGTGKTDQLLQIEGELYIPHSVNNRLKELRMSEGMVLYGDDSRITTGAPLHLENMIFDQGDWAGKQTAEAFLISESSTVDVSNCLFRNLNYGLLNIGKSTLNNPEIRYSNFKSCRIGIYASGGGITLLGDLFDNCIETGMTVSAPDKDIKISECRFQANVKGVDINNRNGSARYVFCETSTFHSNQYGLLLNQCQASVTCSQFIGNSTGIYAVNGELNICPTRNLSGALFSGLGGNNTFAYNDHAGIYLSSVVLFMMEGQNNFIQSSAAKPYNFLKGDIAYSSRTHQTSSPYALKAAGNYWDPAPQGSLASAAMTHYFVMFPYPGSSSTMNYFSGSIQSELNTRCYSQGCNPCAISAQDTMPTSASTLREIADIAILGSDVTNDRVQMDISLQQNESYVMVKIFTLDGKMLYQQNDIDGPSGIDVSGIAEGMYLLEIHTNQRQEYRKILIRR